MPFASLPSQIGPWAVRNVLCTTWACAMLRVEEIGGRRQTVMLMDPDHRSWPTRLRGRESLPPHPRFCKMERGAPEKVRIGNRTFYYLGTESLSGWTVLDEIARDGAVAPLERAVRLCAEAAEAICCAHDAGQPHGHLEPGCLFIQTMAPDDEGHVKLLGAGLSVVAGPASRAARYRLPGTHPQTPVELRDADLLALGCILFHMVTGQAPQLDDPISIAAKIADLMLETPLPGDALARAGGQHRRLAAPGEERPGRVALGKLLGRILGGGRGRYRSAAGLHRALRDTQELLTLDSITEVREQTAMLDPGWSTFFARRRRVPSA